MTHDELQTRLRTASRCASNAQGEYGAWRHAGYPDDDNGRVSYAVLEAEAAMDALQDAIATLKRIDARLDQLQDA